MGSSLLQEDSSCRVATKLVHHNLLSLCSRDCKRQLLKPERLEPVLCNRRSHRSETPVQRTKGVVPARRN